LSMLYSSSLVANHALARTLPAFERKSLV